MKKKYDITGMTCKGCSAGLSHILNEIPEVIHAEVHLENKEAIVTLNKALEIDVFRKAIPSKYVITEKIDIGFTTSDTQVVQEKRQLQQLFPLFLIFGYITIAAVWMNYNSWTVDGFMLDFMGLFYVVFSFFKMLDLQGFPKSFKMYDPLAKRVPLYGWIYPFIEVVLGIMFLVRFRIDLALVITILVLGTTTIGVVKVLIDKKRIQCACLGTALKLPMTKATFIENSIMLFMAIWMLIKMNA